MPAVTHNLPAPPPLRIIVRLRVRSPRESVWANDKDWPPTHFDNWRSAWVHADRFFMAGLESPPVPSPYYKQAKRWRSVYYELKRRLTLVARKHCHVWCRENTSQLFGRSLNKNEGTWYIDINGCLELAWIEGSGGQMEQREI